MLASGLHSYRGDGPKRRLESISDQVAPRTSPERAAVNTANSSARAPTPPCEPRRFMNDETSFTSTAGMMTHRCHLGGLRQSGVEISLPTRWVQAFAKTARRRTVQHEFDV